MGGCRYPNCWLEVGETVLIGRDFDHDAMEKFQQIIDRLKTYQSRQKFYASLRRRTWSSNLMVEFS